MATTHKEQSPKYQLLKYLLAGIASYTLLLLIKEEDEMNQQTYPPAGRRDGQTLETLSMPTNIICAKADSDAEDVGC